ncbi:DUF6084 family protein [Streptomyces sp. WMMC1477]|uniref:DUF6084 family protein n=1 Tax=Streptomyces sp. WMMC1477 TaxID=3015155 RepID=UPI0022B6C241|nr:DUF6084 family protein [Streptomyces sp. WMMC1477]MCZ7433316.1 DUF6084 family protein [Streptomyces sp. WMMC1477]
MTAPERTTAATPDIPDLSFAVTGVAQERFAAVPTLRFGLDVGSDGVPVRSVSLTVAVRIDVVRRRYDPAEQRALAELFGVAERWGTTLHPLTWTQFTVQVPGFTDGTHVDLVLPCGYDSEIAVTKYLSAVRDGEVPLDFLFSGTVFYTDADGRLLTARVSWSKDATFGLPAELWHELIDRYYPQSPWLRLSRETWGRLAAYRERHVLTGWDETVRGLLDQAGAAPAPGVPAPGDGAATR